MQKKKIAVTQRIIETREYQEVRDALSHDWTIYLLQFDFIPVLIPNQIKDVVSYVEEFGCDAVILTNGENVELSKNDMGEWEGSVRDVMEARLLDWAIENNIPVLGVCRGMQLMNCYFGGRLQKNIEGHVTSAHEITITVDYFKKLYGTDSIKVNSYHRSGITFRNIGKGLVDWAHKGDIIEGFVHNRYRILGVEWHPERHKPISPYDKVLIENFFNNKLDTGNILVT